LPLQSLQAYRQRTFRSAEGLRLRSIDEAVRFVEERGYIFFWPNRDLVFPSLWAAAAGDRPVPDEHDDPGHITWDWKDSLLGKKRWYYARVIRRRNTIISLETAPYFYAISENYGSPEEDYLDQYRRGRLTQEAKSVYEALLREGPLDTIALRRAAHLANQGNQGRFARALDDLQIDLKILPVGVSDAGAWHYAFIYDLTTRHFPDLPDQARGISEPAARDRLAELFWKSLGAATFAQFCKAFGWGTEMSQRVVDRLISRGFLVHGIDVEGFSGEAFALPGLLSVD
ncbi:MAG TPA: crosslink repair DNA glycosylase YcaQ family protein, partial [Anaerolineaceae bacterium]